MEHVLEKFRSRPLSGRGRAKELRHNFFNEIVTSGVGRKSVSSGGTFWLGCLMTGMADALHLGGEIYGAFRGSHLTFTQRPDEVKVSGCYSADFCTPTRGYFSSIPSGNDHFSAIFSLLTVPFMRFRRHSRSERSNVVPGGCHGFGY